MCPGYNGNNASLFQRASVLVANKLHDYALKRKINFLFDGTFANESYAILNIERSIAKRRKVQIFYLYQDPIKAWKFTQARQKKDGRLLALDVFINDYFKAREVVNKVKSKFTDNVIVSIIIKDYFHNKKRVHFNIQKIDNHLKSPYNIKTLEAKLKNI